MKHTRRLIPLLLCLLLLAVPSAAAPQSALRHTQPALVYGEGVTLYSYLIDGRNYVRLRDAALFLSGGEGRFSVEWQGGSATVVLTSGAAYRPDGSENRPHPAGSAPLPDIRPAESRLVLDGKSIGLRAFLIGGSHYYSLRELCEALGVSVWWDGARRLAVVGGDPALQNRTVLVDAGHGGAETGMMSPWLGREDVLNHEVASHLASLLRAAGCNVVESRPGRADTVSLGARMKMITSLKPDLVVSVHHNASERQQYSGATVLAQVADEGGGPSRRLAELLGKWFAALGQRVNPVTYRRNSQGSDYYGLLRAAAGAGVPAVITEYAFIDHSADYMAVDTPQKRRAEAQAIFDAVAEWFALR